MSTPYQCANCGEEHRSPAVLLYDERVEAYFCDAKCDREHIENNFDEFMRWYRKQYTEVCDV